MVVFVDKAEPILSDDPLFWEEPPREHSPGWDRCEGAVIPDLVNVFFPTGDAYIWFRGCHDGPDMYIEPIPDLPELGSLSGPLRQEIEHTDWAGIADHDIPFRPDHGSTWTWLLQNGIAPHQPFLMRFGEPEWTKCGYEEPEWDVEYDVELVRVIPWKPESAARRWERANRERNEFFAWRERRTAEVAEARRTRIDCMYTTVDLYFAERYCDGDMPGGVRHILVSDYRPEDGFGGGWAHLATGESARGNHDEAFAKLVENVAKAGLALDAQALKALPRRFR